LNPLIDEDQSISYVLLRQDEITYN
jgi:hypothetical protein